MLCACRNISKDLTEIKRELTAAIKTQQDLVDIVAARTADNEELRKENLELRKMLNSQENVKHPTCQGKQLLIVDGTMDSLSTSQPDKVEIVQKQDATLKDCQNILTDKLKAKTSYNKITIVAGGNDCDINSVDTMTKDVSEMVMQAKTMATTVEICSILPCAGNPAKQDKIDQYNSATTGTCKKLGASFVNNDPGFRLADGEINEGFLQDDGIHPNQAGCLKLLKTLHLQDAICITPTQPWSKAVSGKRKAPKPQTVTTQRAPCWNCGEPNHTSDHCFHRRRLTCRSCGKQGHKASRCGH
jgi:lysophospholipase L1-like esterase